MSFVGSMLSNSNGSGFQATQANLQQPTTATQATDAYGNSQQALQQQQQLVQALQAQNGLGNQSQVYNQLQGVANGTGANPVQAQLAQSTGQNVANQAALAAGQRGASGNVGLMARQAGQTGAATQQNAVGQAATLQANQSLNALNSMGSLANQQAANQISAVGNTNQYAQNEQSNLLNSINGQNNSLVSSQSNANNANAGIAQGNQASQAGLVSGVGTALASGHAQGGMVKGMADGGVMGADSHAGLNFLATSSGSGPVDSGPASNPYASQIKADFTPKPPGQQSQQPANIPMAQSTNPMVNGMSSNPMDMGPQMPAAAGAGPMAGATPLMAAAVAKGGQAKQPMLPFDTSKPAKVMKEGGEVPGKAKVKGNSLKNDTVPAMLSPGEIVIPRNVLESSDPAGNAAKFVAAHMAKNGRMPGGKR